MDLSQIKEDIRRKKNEMGCKCMQPIKIDINEIYTNYKFNFPARLYFFIFGRKLSESEKFGNRLKKVMYFKSDVDYPIATEITPIHIRIKTFFKKLRNKNIFIKKVKKGVTMYDRIEKYINDHDFEFKTNRMELYGMNKDHWFSRDDD